MEQGSARWGRLVQCSNCAAGRRSTPLRCCRDSVWKLTLDPDCRLFPKAYVPSTEGSPQHAQVQWQQKMLDRIREQGGEEAGCGYLYIVGAMGPLRRVLRYTHALTRTNRLLTPRVFLF